MQFHQLAGIFPLLEGEAFAELVADVKAHGVREPIWLADGQILDGRNRWRAAQAAGRECPTRNYEGDEPAAFVVSLNLHRRHLSESQRAMVAAKLATMKQGARTDIASIEAMSQSETAKLLNVSRSAVQRAREVIENAPPEVTQAVERGDMAVSLAAAVTELPQAEQRAIADAPPESMREAAREAVHNHRAQGTGENEWYTPGEFIEAAREFMGGIDLDPASSEAAQKTVKAKRFFTVDDDGLSKDWEGRVWLNPPYAQPAIAHFADKAVAEADNFDECVMLTHNYTDTAWFHKAMTKAAAVCFTRGRIGFLSPEGKKAAPTQGQAFFYFGARPDEFADSFCRFGFVVVPA